MAQVAVVVGFGPGVSTAVAEKFGSQGFAVALVSRNRERLDAGVAALTAKGVTAEAFVADAAQPAEIERTLGEIRSRLGPITVLEWTAYGLGAGDLLAATPDELRSALDLPITGLLAAVRAALPDLKQSAGGAVLITNGSLAYYDAATDELAVTWKVMGLAVANAAKHKLAGLLAQRLKSEGVFVGEVMIQGTVKGTAFDQGQANIAPAAVANAFWQLYAARAQHFATVG